jgi:molybdopterin synthase sulfur carrier subunit
MDIKVRYFASMRDRIGRTEDSVSINQDAVTVEDLWKQISGGEDLPNSTLIAVNMEYTDGSHALKNGDEVAFFPPVTGG